MHRVTQDRNGGAGRSRWTAGVALLALLALTLALAACSIGLPSVTQGSGNIKVERRDVSGFNAVSLSGEGTLTILQTGTESLTLVTDDNILPLLTSKVNNGVLDLGEQSGSVLKPTKGILWNLTVNSLANIALSGAGNVVIPTFNAPSLTVSVSGAGSVNIQNLSGDSLVVEMSGAGNVSVAGHATSQSVTMSGAGSYQGRDYTTANTTVNVSGVGSATVDATATLDATISGVGSVTYYGAPQVTQHVSGIGSVKKGT